MATSCLSQSERATRKRLVNLIVTEDDPDVRALLATLLAFGEVEVDEESPHAVGTTAMRLLGEGQMVDFEEIGTGIRRYRL